MASPERSQAHAGITRHAAVEPLRSAVMHLSRRGFLAHAGQSLALAGTGLLAACQSGPPPPTITVTSSAASAPTAQPAIKPVASVSPATVAASPSTSPAVPSASPAVVAAASPSPARPPVAAGAVAGKPQYQMDAQHTGRSPHTGPRRL